jgi:hypothetical protein
MEWRRKASARLTLKIFRQLGGSLAQPRRLLKDLMKLIGDLEELAAGRCQIHRGSAEVMLQVRHLRFERHLLAGCSLGGVSGNSFNGGSGGSGPLGGLLGGRHGRMELLDLCFGESQPRR